MYLVEMTVGSLNDKFTLLLWLLEVGIINLLGRNVSLEAGSKNCSIEMTVGSRNDKFTIYKWLKEDGSKYSSIEMTVGSRKDKFTL